MVFLRSVFNHSYVAPEIKRETDVGLLKKSPQFDREIINLFRDEDQLKGELPNSQ